MQRIWRSFTFGVLGASIASGGFYVGFAHAQTYGVVAASARFEPDFTKVPPTLLFITALRHTDDLKLTPNQVSKIEKIKAEDLPRYLAAQKTSWLDRVSLAEKEDSGDVIRVEGALFIRYASTVTRQMPVLQQIEIDAVKRVSGLMTSDDQRHKLMQFAADARGYRYSNSIFIFAQPKVRAALEESPKQSKQISLAFAAFAYFEQHQSIPKIVSADTVGPLDDAKNVAILTKSKPLVRMMNYFRVTEYLSPLQQLKLEGMLDEHFNVRP